MVALKSKSNQEITQCEKYVKDNNELIIKNITCKKLITKVISRHQKEMLINEIQFDDV